jgi:ribonuclease HI
MRLRGLHRFLGLKTNNEAEYLALIEGLKAVA